jgi:DNA-binding MarR family transcriptional regulator
MTRDTITTIDTREIILTPAGIDLFMGTILDLKEPMTTLRIFIEVAKRLEPETTKATAGRKELSESLGMHPSRVSRCLAALITHDLIKRDKDEKGVLHLRPDLAWCGSPQGRNEALALWSNL